MPSTLPDSTSPLAPDVFIPPFGVGPHETQATARARLTAFKAVLADYETLLGQAEAAVGQDGREAIP